MMVSGYVFNPHYLPLTVFPGPVSVEYHSIDAEVFDSIHHCWIAFLHVHLNADKGHLR